LGQVKLIAKLATRRSQRGRTAKTTGRAGHSGGAEGDGDPIF
jgi:hypothetical protein